MLRGRIVSANGIKAEDLKPGADAAWVLQSDRGITYAATIPAGSRVVEGRMVGPDYDGPPLVSFEKKIAEGLGLKLGDPIIVNVLGRNITATSPICAPSIGKASASISCWSFRPAPSAARRIRTSPR